MRIGTGFRFASAVLLPELENIQALQCLIIQSERAALDLSCDGSPVAQQTVLRCAVRICHGNG